MTRPRRLKPGQVLSELEADHGEPTLFEGAFPDKSKAEMVALLHEKFSVPVGSARRMNKSQLLETYQGCVNNELVHEVIARQASRRE